MYKVMKSYVSTLIIAVILSGLLVHECCGQQNLRSTDDARSRIDDEPLGQRIFEAAHTKFLPSVTRRFPQVVSGTVPSDSSPISPNNSFGSSPPQNAFANVLPEVLNDELPFRSPRSGVSDALSNVPPLPIDQLPTRSASRKSGFIFDAPAPILQNESPRSSDESDDSVSPFWADPEGRAAPDPPRIAPEDLVTTRVPCSSLTAAIPPCRADERYRRFDGSCNNLRRPSLGRANTPLQRMFRHPADPSMMRRLSVTGKLLPNPRVVSEAFREAPRQRRKTDANVMVMALGQFIDHDMVAVPVAEDPDRPGADLVCNSCDSWKKHPACAPIPIPKEDSFFKAASQHKCLPFTRSAGLPTTGSSGRVYSENVNINTPSLDLSTVYGSHACSHQPLRMYEGGLLLTTTLPGSRHGLPLLAQRSRFPACHTRFRQCYLTGDPRGNEHVALLVLHTTFLREHNRLADALAQLNPAWDDNTLFQEARAINIAQYQHIVYNEFLPVLLGTLYTTFYNLRPTFDPFGSEPYNEDSSGQVVQEFSTAAFRVGHTFVPDDFMLLDKRLMPIGSLPLTSMFRNPSVILKKIEGTVYDAMTRGLLATRLEGSDLFVAKTLRNKLFAQPGKPLSGEDLFSRNIARGRDHGLAPYTAFRRVCGLPRVQSWAALSPLVPEAHVAVLRRVYAHWDDIDLFVGGLAETVAEGGLVGPTFGCIISLQFFLTKTSDRFWYSGASSGLTPPQLSAIKQMGQLSDLIARNLDESESLVPSAALLLPNHISNPTKEAQEYPAVDMSPWQDQRVIVAKTCQFKGKEYPAGALIPSSPCLDCICAPDGSMHCTEYLVDCGVLDIVLPGALTDEHCYRQCPPPSFSPHLDSAVYPPPSSPLDPFFRSGSGGQQATTRHGDET